MCDSESPVRYLVVVEEFDETKVFTAEKREDVQAWLERNTDIEIEDIRIFSVSGEVEITETKTRKLA